MKLKENLALIITTSAITGTIVLIAFIFLGQTKKSPDQQVQEVQSSMDDHHKPVASDTSDFDNLIGKQAIDFTLEDYDGKKIILKSLKGKNVLLFFNEGLMCYPACWNQIAAFGKDERFNNSNTVTYSIVVDERRNWKEALDKMPELSGSPVLFDTNRTVSLAYGVLTLNSSMHKGQFPGHTYVLIDKNGIIRKTLDDYQMVVRNDELAEDLK